MSLMKVEAINSAVHHLRHNDGYIYAATDSEVNRSTAKPTNIII